MRRLVLAAAALVACGGLVACDAITVDPRPSATQTAPASSPTSPEPEPTEPEPEPTEPEPAEPTPPTQAVFPGPDDTGAPPCETLKQSSSVTVTVQGTEFTDTCITGTLTIKATDVVVRRVWVSNTGRYPVHVQRGASGSSKT